MSTPDDLAGSASAEGQDTVTTLADALGAAEKRKLDLTVEISDVGPCKKHLKVAIPHAEIERQYQDSLGTMRRDAHVPGFRPGRAPSVLVMKRFRKEVQGQVKSALLMAALEQLDDDYKINPITRPELDMDAIELPDDGPLKFEMDVEVQPEFGVPEYKGLTLERPVREIGEADVDAQIDRFRERYAQEVPKLDGSAEPGDIVIADLVFARDGVEVNRAKEIRFRLQSELRFQDGRVPDVDKALAGARPGDVREATAHIGTSSPDPALRGQAIQVAFHVLDLKTLRLPEMDQAFLDSVGFDAETDLRTALREMLQRRFTYAQRQALRESVLTRLVDQTPFDLPADLVRRQEMQTLRNRIFELRQAGMSESEIRAREAELRANAHEQTLKSLKEFFILSRIADAEGIQVEDADLEAEIEAIAERTDETPRRVRARIEKEGLADGLASQILERKTIDRILAAAQVTDVRMDAVAEPSVETLDQSASAEQPAEGEDEAGA